MMIRSMPSSRRRPTVFSVVMILAEGLEGDQGEGVLHAGQRLDLAGDEVADVGRIGEVAFHQEVILAGGRIDLRHLFDGDRIVRNLVGPAELAFHLYEDCLHGRRAPAATSLANGARQESRYMIAQPHRGMVIPLLVATRFLWTALARRTRFAGFARRAIATRRTFAARRAFGSLGDGFGVDFLMRRGSNLCRNRCIVLDLGQGSARLAPAAGAAGLAAAPLPLPHPPGTTTAAGPPPP